MARHLNIYFALSSNDPTDNYDVDPMRGSSATRIVADGTNTRFSLAKYVDANVS